MYVLVYLDIQHKASINPNVINSSLVEVIVTKGVMVYILNIELLMLCH